MEAEEKVIDGIFISHECFILWPVLCFVIGVSP